MDDIQGRQLRRRQQQRTQLALVVGASLVLTGAAGFGLLGLVWRQDRITSLATLPSVTDARSAASSAPRPSARSAVVGITAEREGHMWNLADLLAYVRSQGLAVEQTGGDASLGLLLAYWDHPSDRVLAMTVRQFPTQQQAHDAAGAIRGWSWGRFSFDNANPVMLLAVKTLLENH